MVFIPERVSAVTFVGYAKGSSGSFKVIADDGKEYWCKQLNNGQSRLVPVNDHVVGCLGQMIGAAVCVPALVQLDAIATTHIVGDQHVEPGLAHGSLNVESCADSGSLGKVESDDNRVRYAGFFALHEWLGGGDPQWLEDLSAESASHSHDHGFYFTGPDWTADRLDRQVATPFPLNQNPVGLDAVEVERIALALEALTREDIDEVCANIPEEWNVDVTQRTAMAAFADGRRMSTAEYLRGLISQ